MVLVSNLVEVLEHYIMGKELTLGQLSTYLDMHITDNLCWSRNTG